MPPNSVHRENGFISAAAIEQGYIKGESRRLSEDLKIERERSKGRGGRKAIKEANARLGFDPEDAQTDFEAASDDVARRQWPYPEHTFLSFPVYVTARLITARLKSIRC